ncbi:MAG TPA: hypothetical protein DDW85_10385 [Porphyromonadaceae bacterium]|nr:hypothetical protein [Porphyromonadaceae bacterium]
MKRKFFLGALLLGVFIFSSCVDNEESLSVEQLRNSKSELLKSQAALNAADAEATKILAAAEAALKNAQAEAEKANAQKTAAETEILKLQAKLQETQNERAKQDLELAKLNVELQKTTNEQAKQELEIKKQQLEKEKTANEKEKIELQNALEQQKVVKAQSEASLKQIANQLLLAEQQLQVDLARAEADLLAAQKNLADLKDNLSEAEKAKLQKLSANYVNKVRDLNEAKLALSGLKSQLIQAENDLISSEESKAISIEQNNTQITRNKAQIAVYKQYADYSGNPQALLEAAQAKVDEVQLADDKKQSLWETYNQKERDAQSIHNLQPIRKTDYFKIASDFPGNNYVAYPNSDGSGIGYYDSYSNYQVDPRLWYSYDYIELHSSDKGIFIRKGYQKITLPVADVRRLEIDIRDRESTVEYFDDYINDETTGLAKQYADAKAASAAAKTAWEDAQGTPDEWTEKQNYEAALQNENNVKIDLEDAQSNLESSQDELESYQNAYNVLKDADKLAEIKTAIDAYNAQFTGVAQAYLEYSEAGNDAAILSGESGALWSIYYDASSIEADITNLEDWNKALEQDNKNIAADNSIEETIERLKSTIDAQEKNVAVKQKAADDAKKALEDALPKK